MNKPYDWSTTGLKLDDEDCVQHYLMKYHGGMVWAIHQLDADTSGLCLFTVNKKWVSLVKKILESEKTRKEYLAIVKGEPEWDHREVRASIGMVDERSLGVVSEGGKSARSAFDVIDRRGGFSVVRARIYTGRTHQIRIHLSHLGFPLVGEEWYVETPCEIHHRQALHAYRLTFEKNDTLQDESLLAPVSADLIQLGERLGLNLEI